MWSSPSRAGEVTLASTAIGSTYNVNSTITLKGQKIQVPAGYHNLKSFTVQVKGQVTPVVHLYNSETNTIGARIYTGTFYNGVTDDIASLPWIPIATVLDGQGVSVTPGSYIIVGVINSDPSHVAHIRGRDEPWSEHGMIVDVYNGTYREHAGSDLNFTAVFNDTPPPIPTMTQWALMLFGLGLGGMALVLVATRHRRA